MPRKRSQKPIQARRVVKPRDRKAEYAARNKKAKAWGFRSYWQQRQAGDWASFLRYIRPGDLVFLDAHPSKLKLVAGRWETVPKHVIPEDPKRRDGHFVMKNLTDKQLRRMIEEELARGANLSPVPSLDQRRLLDGSQPAPARRGRRAR